MFILIILRSPESSTHHTRQKPDPELEELEFSEAEESGIGVKNLDTPTINKHFDDIDQMLQFDFDWFGWEVPNYHSL